MLPIVRELIDGQYRLRFENLPPVQNKKIPTQRVLAVYPVFYT